MTLISLLGASVVSMMGAKQRSYIYQINSYKALNIAHAGMEYAIRYASDATLSDSNNFFVTPLTTKLFTFGGGTFDIRYQYNNPCNDNDVITVNGRLSSTTRQVKLHNFRRYISRFTHVPNASYRPNQVDKIIHLPFLNNSNETLRVSSLGLSIYGGDPNKILKEICFSNDPADICIGSAPLTKTMLENGQFEYFSAAQFTENIDVLSDGIAWCHLIFQGASLYGSYTVLFYVGVVGEQPSSLKFNIPPP